MTYCTRCGVLVVSACLEAGLCESCQLQERVEKAEAEVERLREQRTNEEVEAGVYGTSTTLLGHVQNLETMLRLEREENERLKAEAAGLQEKAREILATEDHAGKVCGHCKSRVGLASLLLNLVRSLLTEASENSAVGCAPREEGGCECCSYSGVVEVRGITQPCHCLEDLR